MLSQVGGMQGKGVLGPHWTGDQVTGQPPVHGSPDANSDTLTYLVNGFMPQRKAPRSPEGSLRLPEDENTCQEPQPGELPPEEVGCGVWREPRRPGQGWRLPVGMHTWGIS